MVKVERFGILNNKFNNITKESTMHKLYIFSAIIFCISTVQGSEQCIIKSVNEQVNDLLFADISQFSHEDLISFGLTCQSNHKYLCATAERRKNYILQYYPTSLKEFKSILWNGYVSRAYDKTIMEYIPLVTITGGKCDLVRMELIDG